MFALAMSHTMPYREIAEQFGISTRSVENIVHDLREEQAVSDNYQTGTENCVEENDNEERCAMLEEGKGREGEETVSAAASVAWKTDPTFFCPTYICIVHSLAFPKGFYTRPRACKPIPPDRDGGGG